MTTKGQKRGRSGIARVIAGALVVAMVGAAVPAIAQQMNVTPAEEVGVTEAPGAEADWAQTLDPQVAEYAERCLGVQAMNETVNQTTPAATPAGEEANQTVVMQVAQQPAAQPAAQPATQPATQTECVGPLPEAMMQADNESFARIYLLDMLQMHRGIHAVATLAQDRNVSEPVANHTMQVAQAAEAEVQNLTTLLQQYNVTAADLNETGIGMEVREDVANLMNAPDEAFSEELMSTLAEYHHWTANASHMAALMDLAPDVRAEAVHILETDAGFHGAEHAWEKVFAHLEPSMDHAMPMMQRDGAAAEPGEQPQVQRQPDRGGDPFGDPFERMGDFGDFRF